MVPQPNTATWFWGSAAQKKGPVAITELQRLVHTKQIGPDTLVWNQGMPDWMPARLLPVLFTAQGQPAPRNDDDGLGLLLPSGPQSGLAIAAGYLGLFGLLLMPLAPVALILGIYALRDIKQHPEKRGRGRAITGIVIGGIMTPVMLVLLASLLR